MIVSLLALGLLFAPSAHAFWRLSCSQPVLDARVDPIVSFGEASSHAHTIQGSNAVSFSTTFEDLVDSNCTTCQIKDDKSIYWTPQLYYEFANGSFEAVSHGGMIVYYLQRGCDNETIQPFPDGLRMITGDPYVRNYTGTPESQAISWLCLDYDQPYQPQTPGFNNTKCKDGLRAQAFFASCWDGQNLDSADHKSHMAYPSGIDNGCCPSSHPVHLVSLFYELWYSVDKYNQVNDGGRFVLSTGDPTGYSLHGDFYDGWNKDVLQRAVDNCTAESGVIEDCPVFENEGRFNSDDEMNSCAAPNPIPGEDVGDNNPIPYLPGCVAITPGPAPATPNDLDPNCLAAKGMNSSSSSSIPPASSSLADPLPSTTPGSSDNSVPSSSLASPLPTATPASGAEFISPNSSLTSPLPSTTPNPGDDSVIPSSSPAMPSPSTPGSGNDSVPSSSLASPLPSTTPAPGDDSVPPSSSPAMPSLSTPGYGNDSVPSSSLSSPLPSTTPDPGDDSVPTSISPAMPSPSTELECDDDDDDDSVPSSSLASPLPSTTPAPGDDSVPPSSSPAVPLPSSGPLPSYVPLPDSVPGPGDDSGPSNSSSTVLSTQLPPSSTSPVPSSVSSTDPMLSSSPALPSPSGGNNDTVDGNGTSSPIPSTSTVDPASTSLPTPSSSSSMPQPSGYDNNNSTNGNGTSSPIPNTSTVDPASTSLPTPSSSSSMPQPSGYDNNNSTNGNGTSSPIPNTSTVDPASTSLPTPSSNTSLPQPSGYDNNSSTNGNGTSNPIPNTSTVDPASTSLPTPSSSSSTPQPSGYDSNNSTNNKQDDGSDNDGGSCTGHPRPSASNKASRALSGSARRRHHARRGGHGTNLGL